MKEMNIVEQVDLERAIRICDQSIRRLKEPRYNHKGSCKLSRDLRKVDCPHFSDNYVFTVPFRSGEEQCYLCTYPDKK